MTTASDPAIYPAARKRTTADLANLGIATQAPPRTRVIPFYVRGTLNRRTTFSTGVIQGPAILKQIILEMGGKSDPPASTVEIGTSLVPVTENAVLTSVPRTWDIITELLDPGSNIASNAGDGFPSFQPGTPANATPQLVNYVLPSSAFYIVVAFWCNAATTTAVAGSLVIVEGIDPEALRFFL